MQPGAQLAGALLRLQDQAVEGPSHVRAPLQDAPDRIAAHARDHRDIDLTHRERLEAVSEPAVAEPLAGAGGRTRSVLGRNDTVAAPPEVDRQLTVAAPDVSDRGTGGDNSGNRPQAAREAGAKLSR